MLGSIQMIPTIVHGNSQPISAEWRRHDPRKIATVAVRQNLHRGSDLQVEHTMEEPPEFCWWPAQDVAVYLKMVYPQIWWLKILSTIKLTRFHTYTPHPTWRQIHIKLVSNLAWAQKSTSACAKRLRCPLPTLHCKTHIIHIISYNQLAQKNAPS